MSLPLMRGAIDQPGGADRLALRKLPPPELGPGEVLTRVATVGIKRQDFITMVGRIPNPYLRLPRVPELAPAGTIADVGSSVSRP